MQLSICNSVDGMGSANTLGNHNTSNKKYIIENLQPSTEYEVEIFAYCEDMPLKRSPAIKITVKTSSSSMCVCMYYSKIAIYM